MNRSVIDTDWRAQSDHALERNMRLIQSLSLGCEVELARRRGCLPRPSWSSERMDAEQVRDAAEVIRSEMHRLPAVLAVKPGGINEAMYWGGLLARRLDDVADELEQRALSAREVA